MRKIDHLLSAALSSVGNEDEFLDVVIEPSSSADLETISSQVAELGGTVGRATGGGVNSRVPAGNIDKLASSEHVDRVRLARLQQMHGL